MALTSYPFVTLTAGAANTKGSYVQIVASTPYASSRLHLRLLEASASARFLLVDLATGGVGAESVIVANVATASDADNMTGGVVAIDVDIPSGTRLAARCQSVTASTTLSIGILLEDRALGGLATPVTSGSNTAASRGTQVDPGTTINTKGSYVELAASTSARIDALAVCATSAQQGQAISLGTGWFVDVAGGALGAESIIIPDLVVQALTNNDRVAPALVRVPVTIPAGTRLAVRCQCNRSTATERLLCVTLIGMQEPASGGAAGAVAYVG